jgi:hypothetical protein
MAKHLTREQLALEGAELKPAKAETDRSFGLPTFYYGATFGLYFAFLAIMAMGFGNSGLIIPMAIFAIFFAMALGVPAMWVKMKPNNISKSMTLDQLDQRGMMTHTGMVTIKDATLQVLILPVLIMLWGVVVTIIAANT